MLLLINNDPGLKIKQNMNYYVIEVKGRGRDKGQGRDQKVKVTRTPYLVILTEEVQERKF